VDPRVQEAYDLVLASKVNEAVALANTILGEDPKNAPARNIMGIALYKTGDVEGAVEQYGRALEVDPKFAEAHFNLGNAYQRLGRVQDAEASFASAIRYQKKFVLAHYNLGHIYFSTGRKEEAIVELRRAVDEDDQFYPAYILLGQISYDAGDFPAAIESLSRALELYSRSAELHVLLGNSWLQSGHAEAFLKAEASFRSAVGIDSTSVDAIYSLGMALASQDKNDEAAQWLRRTRPLVGDRPEFKAITRQVDDFFQRTGLPVEGAVAPASATAPEVPAQG
jgi:tetratricopeptide (TPR) repeat protein